MNRAARVSLGAIALSCVCPGLAQRIADHSAGWHYEPGGLSFHFKGSKGRRFLDGSFSGFCLNGGPPKFYLANGDYPSVDTLTLKVGGRSWTLDVLQGDHGRIVYVKDAVANHAIAGAKGPIELAAQGGWRLTLRPGSLLARLSRDCAAMASVRKAPD